jgi:hypothetical protein
MATTQELRRSLRVKITNGMMRIHHPVMPPLTCTMLDISEGGARTRMDTSPLDDFASTAWRQLLGSGKLITVEIMAPGVSQRCMVHADVRHIRLGDNYQLEFGLKFHKPDAMQLDVIHRAIRAYSRNRERHPYQEATITTEDEPITDKRPTSTVTMERPGSTRRLEPVVVPSQPQQQIKPKTLADAARQIWSGLVGPKAKPGTNYRGMKIGEILMRTGRITPRQAVEAYEKSRSTGVRFGRYLVRERIVTPVELTRALSLQTGIPVVDLANVTLPDTVRTAFPSETLKEHTFVPFNQFGQEVYVAVTKPFTKEMQLKLERECGLKFKVFLASDEVIEGVLSSNFFEAE